MLCRALYSMIQFTTITLLYSFASSLGDFEVPPRFADHPSSQKSNGAAVLVHRPIHYHPGRSDEYAFPFAPCGMYL
jgi:hypothetical protein